MFAFRLRSAVSPRLHYKLSRPFTILGSSSKKTYYQVLEIDHSSDIKAIKKAFMKKGT